MITISSVYGQLLFLQKIKLPFNLNDAPRRDEHGKPYVIHLFIIPTFLSQYYYVKLIWHTALLCHFEGLFMEHKAAMSLQN